MKARLAFKIPDTSLLIVLSLSVGLAQFSPEPHLVQKSKLLLQGALQRPVDIFDLAFHALPFILLLFKLVTEGAGKGRRSKG